MRAMRGAAWLAALGLVLTAVGSVAAWAQAEPAGGTEAFDVLLREAQAEYDRGDPDAARGKLYEAARLTSGEMFHVELSEAAERYDSGRPQGARAALKRAIRSLNPWGWVILGFVAQGMFVGRFAIQWLASERRGESVIPIAFWYFSLFGSWGLLAYAVWRQDIVIIAGQAFNSIIYIRNLMLIYRKRRGAPVAEGAAE
jgi:lipid-A-disaccharide synthase-like uncharacterized protein